MEGEQVERSIRLVPVSEAEFAELTEGVAVPIEQSLAWDAYDRAVPGRRPWKRFAFYVDDQPAAVVALAEYLGRGFHFLWAKHGPEIGRASCRESGRRGEGGGE